MLPLTLLKGVVLSAMLPGPAAQGEGCSVLCPVAWSALRDCLSRRLHSLLQAGGLGVTFLPEARVVIATQGHLHPPCPVRAFFFLRCTSVTELASAIVKHGRTRVFFIFTLK